MEAAADRLQPAALGELLDLFENQRGLVAGARVFVPAAHVLEGRVALGRGRVPVQALPFGAEELAERVPRRQAHADAVGPQLLDRRRSQVLWLAYAHV